MIAATGFARITVQAMAIVIMGRAFVMIGGVVMIALSRNVLEIALGMGFV